MIVASEFINFWTDLIEFERVYFAKRTFEIVKKIFKKIELRHFKAFRRKISHVAFWKDFWRTFKEIFARCFIELSSRRSHKNDRKRFSTEIK